MEAKKDSVKGISVTVRLPSGVLSALDRERAKIGMARASYIRQILTEHVREAER